MKIFNKQLTHRSVFLTAIGLSVTILACDNKKSKEEIAKKLIRDHLYVTLHDFKGYEPVKFDKLDSAFTSYSEDSVYKLSSKKFDEYLKAGSEYNEKAQSYMGLSFVSNLSKLYLRRAQESQDSAEVYLNKMTDISKNYMPIFKGWKMAHSYRSKNTAGNSMISHFMYYFDKDLKEVVNHKDIGGDDVHDSDIKD